MALGFVIRKKTHTHTLPAGGYHKGARDKTIKGKIGNCNSVSGSDRKESACNVGDLGSIPGLGGVPGKGMTTHSSVLTWRIPWRGA